MWKSYKFVIVFNFNFRNSILTLENNFSRLCLLCSWVVERFVLHNCAARSDESIAQDNKLYMHCIYELVLVIARDRTGFQKNRIDSHLWRDIGMRMYLFSARPTFLNLKPLYAGKRMCVNKM